MTPLHHNPPYLRPVTPEERRIIAALTRIMLTKPPVTARTTAQ
jgi:hypothetical protein